MESEGPRFDPLPQLLHLLEAHGIICYMKAMTLIILLFNFEYQAYNLFYILPSIVEN